MAAKVTIGHEEHVKVCLENQRRIESRFTGVETKLDKQTDDFRSFKDALQIRMDVIKDNDNRRYVAMMRMAVLSLLGIVSTGVTVAVQVIFHFWK